jgi:integrase
MSRQAKGPRLYLRKGRADPRTGKPLPDRWFIRDGAFERSTGCGPERVGDAEQKLAAYIAEKWSRPIAESDPTRVLVADVLGLYGRERGPKLKADTATMVGFTTHLLAWWGERNLADVRRSTCIAYTKHRTSQPIRHGDTGRTVSDQTARRELEMLSAAIGYYDKEYHLTRRPTVVLPEKAESHRDALTRADAAKLLKAALGYRLKGKVWERLDRAQRGNRRHMARFLLIGLYTGSRSDVVKRLRWTESLTDPWVDLDKGVIYRRGRDERDSATKRRPLVKLPRRLASHMARWKKADEKKGRATVLHFAGEEVGSVRRAFASCVADAGLSGAVTPHWLRHTAATWLMERGVDTWEASGYLGMTAATLEKHYGHHRPDHQSAARKALG